MIMSEFGTGNVPYNKREARKREPVFIPGGFRYVFAKTLDKKPLPARESRLR